MNEQGEMNMTVEDIDFNVFYDYYPGYAAETRKLPEDCYPASPAEVEITGVYTCDGNGIDSNWDLLEIINDDVISQMAAMIEEMHDGIE